jgi:uncharacterized phage protein gp47/JayE
MSGTVAPVSPTAAYVDRTGIHAPDYAAVLAFLKGQLQAIYGSDTVIDNDSQDGQLIGIFALALSDTNAACVAVYNSFSPSTAQGVGLSSMVKINGMARHVPSNSTAPMTIIGVAGTVITNGIVQDTPGNNWALPASVTIPPNGDIIVTATCQTPGAVTAPDGDISRIYTVTLGWQSATNGPVTVGAPVESDALLRIRQSVSTALPALSVLSGIIGAVAALPGVIATKGYENDTNVDYTTAVPPLGEGPLPPHSISLVVQGGDAIQICQTILLKKTPGAYTYGSTRELVDDVYGLPHDIGFFIPTAVAIGVHITLTAKAGYSTIIAQAIRDTVAAYINGLGSGVSVIYSKLWLPANLDGATDVPENATATYDITAMTMASPVTGTYGTANITLNIFQMAVCDPTDVIITVS